MDEDYYKENKNNLKNENTPSPLYFSKNSFQKQVLTKSCY